MPTFKPMLASPPDPKHPIRFPALASPKIDGVRAIVQNGVLVSRSLKPIRNEHVQCLLTGPLDLFDNSLTEGFDGELVVGSATDPHCMQNTTSGVMRKDGTPDFTFCVFDLMALGAGFEARYSNLAARAEQVRKWIPQIRLVPHVLIHDSLGLAAYEQEQLELGYEGIMVRSLNGPYKFGRSSAKEGYLLKIKRFVDDEAVVVGVEELMHNANAAKTNALGRTERSTAKAGLRGADTLGKLIVRRADGVEFGIGTGFTAAQRAGMWEQHGLDPGALIGRIVTYKHFANGGVKDAPRFPVFKAFRDVSDLS